MISLISRLLAVVFFLGASQMTGADPVRFTVHGLSSLTQPAILALDFTSSGGNDVTLKDFQSDGTLDVLGTTGSGQGSLSAGFHVAGSSFFNEIHPDQ